MQDDCYPIPLCFCCCCCCFGCRCHCCCCCRQQLQGSRSLGVYGSRCLGIYGSRGLVLPCPPLVLVCLIPSGVGLHRPLLSMYCSIVSIVLKFTVSIVSIVLRLVMFYSPPPTPTTTTKSVAEALISYY